MKRLLKEMSPEERRLQSSVVCGKLRDHPRVREARRIGVYLAMPEEVQLQEVMEEWQQSKEVYLPYIEEGAAGMRFSRVRPEAELRSVSAKMPHLRQHSEDSAQFLSDPLDVLIVPGLAFDRHRGRLGRGGGFYDAWIARAPPSTYKLAVCFRQQVVDDALPMEEHDQRVDEVLFH